MSKLAQITEIKNSDKSDNAKIILINRLFEESDYEVLCEHDDFDKIQHAAVLEYIGSYDDMVQPVYIDGTNDYWLRTKDGFRLGIKMRELDNGTLQLLSVKAKSLTKYGL